MLSASDKSVIALLDFYLGMHLLARALGGKAVLTNLKPGQEHSVVVWLGEQS